MTKQWDFIVDQPDGLQQRSNHTHLTWASSATVNSSARDLQRGPGQITCDTLHTGEASPLLFFNVEPRGYL